MVEAGNLDLSGFEWFMKVVDNIIMNFTAGGCRQQGQTNHSVDRINHIQNNARQCNWAPPSFSPNLET